MILRDYLNNTLYNGTAPLIMIFDHYFSKGDLELEVVTATNYVNISPKKTERVLLRIGHCKYRSVTFYGEGVLKINEWEVANVRKSS